MDPATPEQITQAAEAADRDATSSTDLSNIVVCLMLRLGGDTLELTKAELEFADGALAAGGEVSVDQEGDTTLTRVALYGITTPAGE